jgi:polyphosphate kinase
MAGTWPVRFEVADLEALTRLIEAPLPFGLRAGPVERRLYRDLYFDTPDGTLYHRGVRCRLRMDADRGRLFTVRVRHRDARGDMVASHAVEASVSVGDTTAVLRGRSEPVRLLEAIVDPQRLVPVMELEIDRRLRRARWWVLPRPRVELAYDAVTVRAGGLAAPLQEVKLRPLGGWGPTVGRVARAIGGTTGLRPTMADKLKRARDLLEALEVQSLTGAVGASREVAVIPFRHGLIGLLHEADGFKVPVGHGKGEEGCRAVLDAAFGTAQAQVRFLGSAPAAGTRPALEVWLARRIPAEHDTAVASGVAWVAFDRLTALVGSHALRDSRTLAALHVVARSDLMREQPTWVPPQRTATSPSELVPLGALRSALRPPGLGQASTAPAERFINADLSLLAFHQRVLALAGSSAVPLPSRVNFLSIFGANLDEFFMVRVGAIKQNVADGVTTPSADGLQPVEQLDAVALRARQLNEQAYCCLVQEVVPLLAQRGVRILRWADLDESGRAHVVRRFRNEVLALLTPLAATPGHPFPHIANITLSLAVMLQHPETRAKHFATVNLPASLPRFIALPTPGHWIPLEAVVCANLHELFAGVKVLRAHAFRVTRSADLRHDEETAPDLLQAVEERVGRRPYEPVVRLEVERSMPSDMRQLLLQEFRFEAAGRVSTLSEADVYEIEWLPALRSLREVAAMLSVPVPVGGAGCFRSDQPVFPQVAERDLLVHFPYDSFAATVGRFLVEASEDPAVVAIKVALYRTDDRSAILQALRHAQEAGKTVAVLVEIKARFDEEHNIEWARELRAAGVHVVYGLPGLKTHAKIALVVRREGEALRSYSYIGTGNFNPATAALYTDFGLFTADTEVGADVGHLFNDLTGYAARQQYRRLLVSPGALLPRLLELIAREAEHARAGRAAGIRAKLNGLDDPEVIEALYAASQAGVPVALVVRGICCLRPGAAGLSERIRVVSILGQFLEHARVLHFTNGGADEYYIGSADWRSRNLRRRVEVVAPIEDPGCQAQLDRVLTVELDDPTAWELRSDGAYVRRCEPDSAVEGAQERLLAEARARTATTGAADGQPSPRTEVAHG